MGKAALVAHSYKTVHTFCGAKDFFLPTVLWRNERRAAREQRCDRTDRARAMTLRGETMKIQ